MILRLGCIRPIDKKTTPPFGNLAGSEAGHLAEKESIWNEFRPGRHSLTFCRPFAAIGDAIRVGQPATCDENENQSAFYTMPRSRARR